MKAGDVLEVEISGVGTLRTRIVDERHDGPAARGDCLAPGEGAL
jgi:hypothetical protein